MKTRNESFLFLFFQSQLISACVVSCLFHIFSIPPVSPFADQRNLWTPCMRKAYIVVPFPEVGERARNELPPLVTVFGNGPCMRKTGNQNGLHVISIKTFTRPRDKRRISNATLHRKQKVS